MSRFVIDVSPELGARLLDEAEWRGQRVADYVLGVLETHVPARSGHPGDAGSPDERLRVARVLGELRSQAPTYGVLDVEALTSAIREKLYQAHRLQDA